MSFRLKINNNKIIIVHKKGIYYIINYISGLQYDAIGPYAPRATADVPE